MSAVVQQFLMEYSQAESDFERRQRLQAETLAGIREFRAADRLGREELDVILPKDLSHGQSYGGVRVVNPFHRLARP